MKAAGRDDDGDAHKHSTMTGGVGLNAGDKAASQAFLKYLTTPRCNFSDKS
jgi:hypothetical protein